MDRVLLKSSNMVRLDGFTSTVAGSEESPISIARGSRRALAVIGNVGSTDYGLILPVKSREGTIYTGFPITVGAGKKLSLIVFPANYESPLLDDNNDHAVYAHASAALKNAHFDWNK